MNIAKIKYTTAHRKAFRQVERQLLGYNTVRSLFHDLDKVILCAILPKKAYNWIADFHRNNSRHHRKAITRDDYIQVIIDWECARITKPDKPLNAKQTLDAYYPELTDVITPLLEELKLV